jgi:hypothetical protein
VSYWTALLRRRRMKRRSYHLVVRTQLQLFTVMERLLTALLLPTTKPILRYHGLMIWLLPSMLTCQPICNTTTLQTAKFHGQMTLPLQSTQICLQTWITTILRTLRFLGLTIWPLRSMPIWLPTLSTTTFLELNLKLTLPCLMTSPNS